MLLSNLPKCFLAFILKYLQVSGWSNQLGKMRDFCNSIVKLVFWSRMHSLDVGNSGRLYSHRDMSGTDTQVRGEIPQRDTVFHHITSTLTDPYPKDRRIIYFLCCQGTSLAILVLGLTSRYERTRDVTAKSISKGL